ncbi:uncharacterized protein EDB91DRAFT_1165731 [Suillus paluster]|uniref:uncharacterized protein n=1 Tax=Suillus paluster TaxID=48578 RepID=UPI001B86E93D|nr:uncharacterized protein EDB91DRAFT_1165731 [Suillus paluster]KAG1726691.1 hypothetical protein EDB91DRAFT_1165731 [Suillus paluster]
MRFSFLLAFVAALTTSISVSADTAESAANWECIPKDFHCDDGNNFGCCWGYTCKLDLSVPKGSGNMTCQK